MRLIDGDKLSEWLSTQGKHEYTHMFAEAAYNNVRNTVTSGHFDIPTDQGEARLREALERISRYPKGEALVYVSEIKGIARDALSSHTEDTGIQKVREMNSDEE